MNDTPRRPIREALQQLNEALKEVKPATINEEIELDDVVDVGGEADEMPELDTVPPSDPPDVRAIAHDAVVEAMVAWFFDNFKDPAHSTPYDGGYVYIWGGPYSAEDEIRNAFKGKASERTIIKAIKQIEQEGWEWAPADSRVQPVRPDKNSDQS